MDNMADIVALFLFLYVYGRWHMKMFTLFPSNVKISNGIKKNSNRYKFMKRIKGESL